MLFISIMLIVWFGFWLYFAYQRHTMLGVITSILIDWDDAPAEDTENETVQKENENA